MNYIKAEKCKERRNNRQVYTEERKKRGMVGRGRLHNNENV